MAESWINITVGGAAAGGAVAALTYATTLASTKALATGTSISFNVLGELAGYGATYLSGSAAGLSVRIMANTVGKASEETIRSSGYLAAAGAATVAGALTALTITVGTKAIQYSVEYGGKITNDMAQKISEAYLKYRLQNTEQIELTEINDKDWVILQLPN